MRIGRQNKCGRIWKNYYRHWNIGNSWRNMWQSYLLIQRIFSWKFIVFFEIIYTKRVLNHFQTIKYEKNWDDFLKRGLQFDSFADVAISAERILHIDMETSVINCRWTIEFAIKWMYSVDDAPLVGLTATPKDEIDKNTYNILSWKWRADLWVWTGTGGQRRLSGRFPLGWIFFEIYRAENCVWWTVRGRQGNVGSYIKKGRKLPGKNEIFCLDYWFFNEDTIKKVLYNSYDRRNSD